MDLVHSSTIVSKPKQIKYDVVQYAQDHTIFQNTKWPAVYEDYAVFATHKSSNLLDAASVLTFDSIQTSHIYNPTTLWKELTCPAWDWSSADHWEG
jgi:hypothetical protein